MKLICYLSNGYPTIEASIKMAKDYVEAGCDVIEVDFPSKNPYLESEFIAGRMADALKECDDYSKYMEGIVEIKNQNPNTKFIVLAYENTIVDMGVENYANFLLNNGFEDVIYVGLEHDEVKNHLINKGIKVASYVQYHLPEDEVQGVINSNGFVYLQAKPTTNNVNPKYPTLKDCINRLRELGITREIYVGVGISTSEDIQMAKEAGADAVFVGSRILKLHNDLPLLKETIKELKEATH